jgi:pyridinium-3,5-biscarboxylic acid mononucleotide synthase
MKPDEDLGYAVLDIGRQERTGYPEVVYCEGKTVEQAEAIILRMRERDVPALGTRASAELAERIRRRCPDAQYDESARLLSLGSPYEADGRVGSVAVVAAGTSDLSVAREAYLTARFFGSETTLITDVGVAGIHRLFDRLEDIRKANVVVAVAGMEGALAGVIAGQVSAPVVAVPTSVGYGAAFGGVAALLGMLTACAPGISVVNIDNGFGGGYMANLINRRIATGGSRDN